MSRIAETFKQIRRDGKHALIPFITAGDPDVATTCDLLVELDRAGASVIELGIPFSDPTADGPVIQRASTRALRNEVDIATSLEIVRTIRQKVVAPVVLFSYFNPILQFGLKRFSAEAKRAGVDGVLVTDLPPEEADELAAALKQDRLDMIFLVAPTSSDERLRLIAQRASGFIYAVARAGVTGAQTELSSEAETLVTRVRAISDLPIAVGFGISTHAQVAEVWRYADAAVVGSALVAEIERLAGVPDMVKQVGQFVRELIPAPDPSLAARDLEQNLEAALPPPVR